MEVLTYRPFYIIGEVRNPGSYPYVTGMTVVNAVALAGGFTYRAKSKAIIVKRFNDFEGKIVTTSMDTKIFPGDVIEVPERMF